MDVETLTKVKCGEIFLSDTQDYCFLCNYCKELFYSFAEFKKHNFIHSKTLNSENIIANINLDEIKDSGMYSECTETGDEINEKDIDEVFSNDIYHLSFDDCTESLVDDTHNSIKSSNEEEHCFKCHAFIVATKHDPGKCDDIRCAISQNGRDFIKLLRKGILCCENCDKNFNDYKKLYDHHITEDHCFGISMCKICKFKIFMNSEMKKSKMKCVVQNKNRETNEKIMQTCSEKSGSRMDSFQEDTGYNSSSNSTNLVLQNEMKIFPFKCDFCERRFRTKLQKTNHTRIHLNERPFKCNLCSSAFTTSANLKIHTIHKHTEERPYVCGYDSCNASFKMFELKKQHEKSHLPGKFQCEMCGNNYRTKFYLSKHQQGQHVDAKDWLHECDVCHKKFSQATYLKDHKRIHTGEKPFGCSLCDKFFRKSSALAQHKKLHSDEKKYVCKVCGKGFKQRAGYWGHMKRHPVIS